MTRPVVLVAVLLDLFIGCGSVAELRTTDAGGDVVEVLADASSLEAAPSDTARENQSDGAAESSHTICGRPDGQAAIPAASDCRAGCVICQWADFSTPQPAGCFLHDGRLCVSDCRGCP